MDLQRIIIAFDSMELEVFKSIENGVFAFDRLADRSEELRGFRRVSSRAKMFLEDLKFRIERVESGFEFLVDLIGSLRDLEHSTNVASLRVCDFADNIVEFLF